MPRPHKRSLSQRNDSLVTLFGTRCPVAMAGLVLVLIGAGALAGERRALFGDLHIHTRYSFDAYLFNVRATPDDAYRYAKGEPLEHPLGYPMRLRGGPLDFYAVTDHATYLGAFSAMGDSEHRLSGLEFAQLLNSPDPATLFTDVFPKIFDTLFTGEAVPDVNDADVRRETWRRIVDAAEEHNEPGRFTTFAGFEYTSNPPFNLHRNVIFAGSEVPGLPFATTDSLNPEDLWRWLDEQRAHGAEAIAIPHNSNWSNGLMFREVDYAGDALDAAYAELRVRNEPLVEITQVKGTSETHPLLSPNDEWADHEIFGDEVDDIVVLGEVDVTIDLAGSYVRDALLAGLEMREYAGFNPYRFGFVGSSDSHNAGASYEEDSFFSKVGNRDGSPVLRGSTPPEGMSWEEYANLPAESKTPPYQVDWSASGLAGVWAEENTREAIFAAFRRKETFATTGPRIRVRAWAGHGLDRMDPFEPGAAEALYAQGIAMGGDLPGSDRPVEIVAQAIRDPRGAWLQRLQVVKGWLQDGEAREKVYDAACSDGLEVDPETHRCPDNGAAVDLNTCAPSIDRGAAELAAHWTDPESDPSVRAFYYVRVLENPTCRWSTWDALRAGIEPRPGKNPVIQERAWTSPIWYVPD